MSRCFLLGAGASYGCHKQKSPPPDQQPPMGKYLFNDGWKTNLLQKSDFASLKEELKKSPEINFPITTPSDLNINTELFLQRIDKQFDALTDYKLFSSFIRGTGLERTILGLETQRPDFLDISYESFYRLFDEYFHDLSIQKQTSLSTSYYYLYELLSLCRYVTRTHCCQQWNGYNGRLGLS